MIEAYRHRPGPRAVGLLTENGNVIGDDAGVIYVGHDRAHRMLTVGRGEAVCWNGDPIRYRLGDREAVVLRVDLPDDAEALHGLQSWGAWLRSYGARPASFGSSAWSLLRATLTGDVHTAWGDVPPVRGIVGGRVEMIAKPGYYPTPLIHHDLRAAYAATLAKLHYGGAWGFVDGRRGDLDRLGDLTAVGTLVYARARVSLAGGAPGPLARRPRRRMMGWDAILNPTVYPVTGRIRGFWSVPELLAARSGGAKVNVTGAWIHAGLGLPFAPWWSAVEAGRGMEGLAGTLAKITGNALYGQLAISEGERAVLSFAGGRRQVRADPMRGAGRPRVLDLAEYVTGSVRGRLYGELIAPGGADVIAVHTDGGWCRPGFAPTGADWRVKDQADVFAIVNPQTLAYRSGDRVTYKVAGVSPADAPRTFAEVWRSEVGGNPPAAITREGVRA